MNGLEKLIQATGTIAEITAIFYKAVIDKVDSVEEALQLTNMFINNLLHGNV